MVEWIQLIPTTLIALFPIVNPFGAVPAFLSMTESVSGKEKNHQLKKSCLFVFLILSTFLIAGDFIMKFFNISVPGIQIAGGIILYRISLSLLNAEPKYKQTKEEEVEWINKKDISFTPLAMPMLSGPGSIGVTLGLTSIIKQWYDYFAIMLAIAIIAASCWFILKASTRIVRLMGVNGMNAMTRMMGFLLLCVAVQFIINGVLGIFGKLL